MTRLGRDPVRAYVGIGSNLGDRAARLRYASATLAAHPCVELLGGSRIYETPPVGPPQGDYLNAVLAIDTTLAPRRLMELCWQIEEAGCRQRTVRWGPRTIDLDLIDVGGCVIEHDDLRLPHPELANRPFVLVPLRDVAHDWVHPVTKVPIDELILSSDAADGATAMAVAEADTWCMPTVPSAAAGEKPRSNTGSYR